eukprot:gene25298-biopygen11983
MCVKYLLVAFARKPVAPLPRIGHAFLKIREMGESGTGGLITHRIDPGNPMVRTAQGATLPGTSWTGGQVSWCWMSLPPERKAVRQKHRQAVSRRPYRRKEPPSPLKSVGPGFKGGFFTHAPRLLAAIRLRRDRPRRIPHGDDGDRVLRRDIHDKSSRGEANAAGRPANLA